MTKREEVELLRSFVAALPPDSYLADLLGRLPDEVAAMIMDDCAWPLSLKASFAQRKESEEYLTKLRADIQQRRNELRHQERKLAQATAELENIRSAARVLSMV